MAQRVGANWGGRSDLEVIGAVLGLAPGRQLAAVTMLHADRQRLASGA
jgi:hypothetical protein